MSKLWNRCSADSSRHDLKGKEILPLNERSPSRSRSSPPAEAGLVGTVVWITGTTSFPPRRSNKSFACGRTKSEKMFPVNSHRNQKSTRCFQNQSFPHLVGRLGHRWWVFRFHRGFRLPVRLDNLRGTIGRTLLHDGHSLQKCWSTLSEDDRNKSLGQTVRLILTFSRKKCYLMWSYFLKSALYSTALC